jgi:hypothetical protein
VSNSTDISGTRQRPPRPLQSRYRKKKRKRIQTARSNSTDPASARPDSTDPAGTQTADLTQTALPGRDSRWARGPPRLRPPRPVGPVKKYPPAPNRFRGVPPPPKFSVSELPDDAFLNETETAGLIRRSKACLTNWRRFPDHPLRWRRIAGRVLYELASIRAFLRGDTTWGNVKRA